MDNIKINKKTDSHLICKDSSDTNQVLIIPTIAEFFMIISNWLDRLLMIGGIISSLACGVFSPIFSVIVGEGINKLGPNQKKEVIHDSFNDTFKSFLWLGISMFFSHLFQIWLWAIISKRLSIKFKEDYFELIFKQDQKWFDQETRYKLNTKVQQQMYLVQDSLKERILNLCNSFALFIASITIAFTTSWKLTIVLIGFAPILTLASYFMDLKIAENSLASKLSLCESGSIVEELLFKFKTVASFANFEYEINRNEEKLEETKKITMSKFFWVSVSSGVYQLVLWGIIALGIWYGSYLIMIKDINTNKGIPIGPGDVSIVLSCIRFACLGFTQLYPNYEDLRGIRKETRDYYTLKIREMISKKESQNTDTYPNIKTIKGNVSMNIKSFKYPKSPNIEVLKNINIQFVPGTISVIVGESGSGKSTLFYLLERFYDLDSTDGEILIDGININSYNKIQLRKIISYIPAEPMLINIPIYENVLMGRNKDTYSLEMIKNSCKIASADEFIQKLPDNYNFLPGMRGELLSLGERQRISIARGILGKPRILLIDEPTSLLDYENEKKIMKVIEALTKENNITTIIISHRLSIIRKSTKIIAMKKGEIVEIGDHYKLLGDKGYYSDLVKDSLMKDSYIHHKSKNSSKSTIINLNLQTQCKNINEENIFFVKPIDNNENNEIINNNHEMNLKENNEILINPNRNEEIKLEIKSTPQKNISLWSLLLEEKVYIIIILIVTIINGAFLGSFGLLSSIALKSISQINSNSQNVVNHFSYIFLAIGIGTGITYYIKNYYFLLVGEKICLKIKKIMFHKFITMDMGFYDKKENNPGKLMSFLETETYTFHGALLNVIVEIIQVICCLIVGLGLGFAYGYITTLIILAFFPFIFLAGYFHLKFKKYIDNCDDEADISSYDYLSQLITSPKTIISYNAQKESKEIFRSLLHNENKSKIYFKSFLCGLCFGTAFFISFLDYAVVVHFSELLILNGTIKIEELLTSLIPVFFVAFIATSLHNLVSTYSRSNVCVKEILDFLKKKTKIDPFENQNICSLPHHTDIKGEITFQNVSFNYDQSERKVLDQISFKINPGEVNGFVSFSGSGKSTIISLLMRFYDVVLGEIRLDGINIKDFDLVYYRSQIAVVLQEPKLFNRTVRENIRYGRLSAKDEEIDRIAEITLIKEILDINYSSSLSIGEKQKIAIGRALIKNPRVLLLDEATSYLDEDSTAIIIKNVLSYVREKHITCVIVTDQLKTLEKADKIYFLEDGSFIEEGSHLELMNQKGRYYYLYKQQQKIKN